MRLIFITLLPMTAVFPGLQKPISLTQKTGLHETGKLFINTSLGTWEHTNGDIRTGEVTQLNYYDELGMDTPSKYANLFLTN